MTKAKSLKKNAISDYKYVLGYLVGWMDGKLADKNKKKNMNF